MKRFAILSLVSLVSASAFAAAPAVLLQYTKSNGTVAPQFRIVTKCDVYSDKITVGTFGAMIDMKPPVTKSILWTPKVNNEETLVRLQAEAKAGRITTSPRPMGGAYESYFSNPDAGPVPLLEVYGGTVTATKNNSSAAKALVKFLDKNCK